MAKKKKKEYRLQSRPCDIVSMDPTVQETDLKIEASMQDPSHLFDIKIERTKL